jgi:hypothetical protein
MLGRGRRRVNTKQKRKNSQRRRTRRKQRGGSKDKKVDLVIARYKEGLEWMKDYLNRPFSRVFIYNKGNSIVEPPAFTNPETKCEVKNIPNVGVVDHTIMHHIVDKYDDLGDVTIFAPGSADMSYRHCDKASILRFTADKAFDTKNTVLNVYKFDVPIAEAMYNFKMDEYMPQGVSNNENYNTFKQKLADIRPFGEWYKANIPDAEPKNATFFGIMAVSRDHVHQRPKSFYENLLRQVSTDKYHEASHFLERSYPGMFHPVPEECMFPQDSINVAVGGLGEYRDLRRKI